MIKKLLIIALILTTTISQGQVTNGLVAKYSFNNGSANDEVGNNNGSVSGAILTVDRFGNANKAYKFTNGEYITLPNASALKSATMSVSLWTKIDGYNPGTNPTNHIYVVSNSTVNAYFGTFAMLVSSADGKYFSVSQNNSSQSIFGSSTSSNNAVWQHYVLTMDDDSLKMYIDGQKQWSYFKGFTSTFSSDLIYIGISGNTTYTGNLNGRVDDIRVYNRVLTGAEVTTLFNEPNPATVGLTNVELEKNVISLYPNPTKDKLYLNFELKINSVEVYDAIGKMLFKQTNSNFIDLNQYNEGIYLLKAYTEQGTLITKKIIKE